jgi:crotonobetainyl-CoA:carnitine CoA-transferase CaiB-like acyl-CoA transferase
MGLLHTALGDLGLEPDPAGDVRLDPPVPLDAALPVGRLAEEAVRFADAAARRLGIPPAPLDPARIATSFSSERFFRLDGETPDVWAPLSGFWPTADGWIRTHANYPHHRRALLQTLAIADRDDGLAKTLVRQALATATSVEVEDAIVAAGGVAAAVRTAEEWHAHPHGAGIRGQPLLRIRHRAEDGDATGGRPAAGVPVRPPTSRPLDGIRVLDLTRVLAGPICCRTLGLWGADVVRIDPPFLPEPEWTHFETGPGKRSALLDLRTERDRFDGLLAEADVLVHGYRPGALRALGLDELVRRRPRLVVASLSAWGAGPWAERRGFDSIVQAASGIAVVESPDGIRPGALPAQALDHSAAYLLAGAVAHLLLRRLDTDGGWSVEVSLARIAEELLASPLEDRRPGSAFQPTVSVTTTDAGEMTQALPALGAVSYRFPPRRFGADDPVWPSRVASAGDG